MEEIDDVGRVSMSGERFEWTIPDFLSHAGVDIFVSLHSPVFIASGMEWKLNTEIPPMKIWAVYSDIRLWLTLMSRHRPAALTPVTFTHGLRTSNGEIVGGNSETQTFSTIGKNFGLHSSIQVTYAELRTLKSTYLSSGTLALAFFLKIGDGSVPSDGEDELTTQAPFASLSHIEFGTRQESERQTRSVEECPRCKNPIDRRADKDTERPKKRTRLEEDFKDLLLNETESDVVLKVGGKEFKAHGLIIRTRSPVLFAMFAHDTEERRTGVVNIEDCDPETFSDFLHYVYTDRVEALTGRKALHLYRTSDKYQLLELKDQCLELLKTSICIDNFCDVLALSLQHSERELAEIATQFFVDNAVEIARTPRWQTFLQENPTTANELFLKSFQKRR